jgi:DNA-binding XRE family transcriptional regulator
MNVRFKKTARGEVAILPRADYERLAAIADEAREDAGMIRLVAKARREIAEGGPLIPIEYVDRMAKGESPIAVMREFRKLTQAKLARATGLGQGYISDLENGNRRGTVDALRSIAKALKVPLDLIAPD